MKIKIEIENPSIELLEFLSGYSSVVLEREQSPKQAPSPKQEAELKPEQLDLFETHGVIQVQENSPWTKEEIEELTELDELVANGEFDSAGVQWDESLHSSTKSKLADGRWRTRRNVGSASPSAPMGQKSVPQPPATFEPEIIDFGAIMQRIGDKGVTNDEVVSILEVLDLGSLFDLMKAPPSMWARFYSLLPV